MNAPNPRLENMNVTPVGQGTGLQAAVRRLARNLATNTVLWCRALVRPVPSISIGRSPGTIVWSVILIVAAFSLLPALVVSSPLIVDTLVFLLILLLLAITYLSARGLQSIGYSAEGLQSHRIIR